ncbi:MAG: hypothetical protein LBJ42_02245, partial [Holosporales bacterium]|nr:hypothetical protein [Holosporales bacterium]
MIQSHGYLINRGFICFQSYESVQKSCCLLIFLCEFFRIDTVVLWRIIMKILQRDIFGTAQLVEEASMDRKPHAASTASKKFPDININSGVDEWQAAGDA